MLIRKKYCFSFFVFFIFCVQIIFAQTNSDLLQQFSNAKSDSVKIAILIQLADANESKTATALQYSLEAKDFADKSTNKLSKISAYSTLAYYYSKSNRSDASIEYYQKSIKLTEAVGNTTLLGGLYSDIANVYYSQSKLDSCLLYNFKALDIRKKENNENEIGISYYGIAKLYRKKNDYDNAVVYYKKAIVIFEKNKEAEFLSKALINYAMVYKAQQMCDSAIVYFNKARDIVIKNNFSQLLLSIQLNAALCLNDLEKFADAKNIFNKLLTQELESDNQTYPWLMYGLGKSYLGLNNYIESIEYLTKALRLNYMNSNVEYVGLVNLALANAFEKINKTEEALQHYKIYKASSDSLYNAKKIKAVDELKTKYETREKEQAIDLLSKENLLKDLSIKQKQQSLMLSALKNKQNEQQIDLLNKDNLVKDLSLKDNRNSLQLSRAKINEQQQQVTILNKENQLKDLLLQEKKRNIIYTTIALVLLSVIAFAALWLYRSKRSFSNQLAIKNEVISKSLQEKEVLLKEIHHRVKNNLQVISSLLNLQSKSITDEAALQALNEGKNRVKSMALIHQNLYRDDNLTGVDIKDYIEKLTSSLFASYNIESNKIQLETHIEHLQLDVDTVIPLGLILNELMSNALKYAFVNRQQGLLQIQLHKQNEQLMLCVQDNGIGMDKDDLNKTNTASIGHKLIQSFLQKLDATMTVEKNNGTKISLYINKFKVT